MADLIPDISIIIPVLNEKDELAELFENLATQSGVHFEVILSDGGSRDGSLRIAAGLCRTARFPARTVEAARGRGEQMNHAVSHARGRFLLFLHADSRFDTPVSLQQGVAHMESAKGPLAGRFAISFRRREKCRSLAYFYYEAKAGLNRCDCIRGDQGFLISREFFEQLGRFDISLPFLEDVRLAALIAEKGTWCLLPATLTTSARRFESEGLYERQTANAVIACCADMGWNAVFKSLPALYRCNSESGKLDLGEFLSGIRSLIGNRPPVWVQAFWMSVGRYVAENAWQLFFWLDVRRAFLSGAAAQDVVPLWLGRYDRYLAGGFSSRPMRRLAALLTRAWFTWMLIRHRRTTKTS